MLTYSSDFWPLFWTFLGGGAVLTVLLSLLVAKFSPAWFRTRHEPALAWVDPELQAAHEHQAARQTEAA